MKPLPLADRLLRDLLSHRLGRVFWRVIAIVLAYTCYRALQGRMDVACIHVHGACTIPLTLAVEVPWCIAFTAISTVVYLLWYIDRHVPTLLLCDDCMRVFLETGRSPHTCNGERA